MRHRIGSETGNRELVLRGSAVTLGLMATVFMTIFVSSAAEAERKIEPSHEKAVVIRGAKVGPPVTPFVFDGDVRELPALREWRPGDPIRAIPQRVYLGPDTAERLSSFAEVDALLQSEVGGLDLVTPSDESFTSPSRNFPGIGFTGVYPPDTVGDVGPNHYVQMVNGDARDDYEGIHSTVRIWDKAEPEPNQLASFSTFDLYEALIVKPSQYELGGDPVVTYDRQADRWVIVQFCNRGTCVYASRTGDPVSGGWYAYAFNLDSVDYPKIAVWATDANGGAGSYVLTFNANDPVEVLFLNRQEVLAGESTRAQILSFPVLPNPLHFTAPTAADADGPSTPPAGAPAIVMRLRDTEVHDQLTMPGDFLEMWLADVDWEDPENTTLTRAADIPVADFDVTLCPDWPIVDDVLLLGCFPQPGTTQTLMVLEEILMHRLQYYRHESYESLVGNFVVDVDDTDHGGVRWFELWRESGGVWALRQEGTYSLDGDHRWMGSIASDREGNLALGYSVTSSVTYPSIRYTGRHHDDPLGLITQPETEGWTGQYSQLFFDRWGDYAAMALDPSDDCTFWFTTEYVGEDARWRTQIASFRFASCGCAVLAPPVLTASVSEPEEIDLSWEDSVSAQAVEYSVERSLVSGGPYETIAVVPDSSPGVAGVGSYAYEDEAVVAGTTYYYVVIARDGEGCASLPLNEVSATATGGTPVEVEILSEDFEEADSFEEWEVLNTPEHDCGSWVRSSDATKVPSASGGYYALSDSGTCRKKTFEVDTSLESPVMDLSVLGVLSATLDLAYRRKTGPDDVSTVEVWDGTSWVVVTTLSTGTLDSTLSLDVTPWAVGNSEFRVRFRHRTASRGNWWSVDDVRLVALVS